MTSHHKGSPSRRLTAVSSRAADARALRSAQSTKTPATQHDGAAPDLHVPAFLLAKPQPEPIIPMADREPARRPSREELIAEAAYLRAASRGFAPGHELDDWLAAEKLVDARLASEAQRQG